MEAGRHTGPYASRSPLKGEFFGDIEDCSAVSACAPTVVEEPGVVIWPPGSLLPRIVAPKGLRGTYETLKIGGNHQNNNLIVYHVGSNKYPSGVPSPSAAVSQRLGLRLGQQKFQTLDNTAMVALFAAVIIAGVSAPTGEESPHRQVHLAHRPTTTHGQPHTHTHIFARALRTPHIAE